MLRRSTRSAVPATSAGRFRSATMTPSGRGSPVARSHTEVGQQKEPVTAIDETSLVYQHPRIALAPPDDVRNIGEEIGPFVGKVRKETLHEQVRSSVHPRYGDTHRTVVRRGTFVAGHQQRAVAASQRTPAAQSAITVGNLRQDGITRLADVRTYSLRGGESRIQLLYILEDDLELQPFGIDASVEHGIEHERVVRTRRNGKR